jgi:hypothetical protein
MQVGADEGSLEGIYLVQSSTYSTATKTIVFVVVTRAIRSTRVAVSHVEILLAISSGSSSCGLV